MLRIVDVAKYVKGAGPIGGESEPLFASVSASLFPLISLWAGVHCPMESYFVSSAELIKSRNGVNDQV